MHHILSGFQLLIAVALVLTGWSGSIRADDPMEMVVLIHPKLKNYADALANKPMNLADDNWLIDGGVYSLNKKSARIEKCRVRMAMGDSVKALKGWSLVKQYGEPISAIGLKGLPYFTVPWVIYYKDSEDGKAVVLGKATKKMRTLDELLKHPIHLRDDLLAMEPSRVFADKLQITPILSSRNRFDGSMSHSVSAPVKLDLKANPPTASVHLHNKFPVPLSLRIVMSGGPENDRLEFQVPGKNVDGEWLPNIVLEAGEKKTLVVDLKGVRQGQEPRWCRIQTGGYLLPLDDRKK
jgi:hypothetical protein